MYTTNEINERISLYEKKVSEYSNKEKFKHKLDVSTSLLNFWKNQLTKRQKSNARRKSNSN